jgi:2,3-bisphosphoglycerate-independent phosphoglycerate mutase
MVNEDGSPNTAHTKNPVPCILTAPGLPAGLRLRHGRLADVAPTILALLGMEKPEVMTGECLF